MKLTLDEDTQAMLRTHQVKLIGSANHICNESINCISPQIEFQCDKGHQNTPLKINEK